MLINLFYYYNHLVSQTDKSKMERTSQYPKKDPFLIQCCLMTRRQPYVGVEKNCDKNAIFCIEHNCHMNEQGLMHQMIPLRDFKRKIDERRFQMQFKIRSMVDVFQKFIDKLIQNLRELKLRKTLQLSMLWLRDLAASEEQYELMKRIYRLDFEDISCRDVKSVYYKIIHNKQLYEKQISQLNCYKGIYQTLNQLSENKKMNSLLSEKLSQIEGVLTNGQILKKLLPDRRILNENLKEVLLEQKQEQNYKISYNKAEYQNNTTNYKSVSSKYPILSHLTYHIYIKTKYSNVMVGVCDQKVKQMANQNDIHYNEGAICFNCANGNTYKQGMFLSGSNQPIKNINELNIKLRLTNNELFLFTNKSLLMRCSINNLKGSMYLFFSARTQGDLFQVHCDNDISSDNIKVLQFLKQQINKNQPNETQEQKQKVEIVVHQNREELFKSFNNNIKVSNQSFEPQIYRQNTFGDGLPSKSIRNERTQKTEVKQKINQVFGQQENIKISKIKESFKNIRLNIEDMEREEEKSIQQRSNKWNIEKSKYLSDIKQKVSMLRQKNINKPSAYDQFKKQNQTQKKMQIVSNQLNPNVKTESSARQISKININPSEVSNIKINLSDQISDLNSVAKNSLLSGLRKQSDNINIEEILRMNAFSQMTESMEPRYPVNNEPKPTINKMKTPPKMFALSKRFQMNQQFDF